MTFSLATLNLFDHLLNQVQVPASSTDFREVTEVIANAKDELATALEEALPSVD